MRRFWDWRLGLLCADMSALETSSAEVESSAPAAPPSPRVQWDRTTLEGCLEQALVRQGHTFSNLGREHEIKVFRVFHVHDAGGAVEQMVCSYFFVAGKGSKWRVAYTNSRGKNRHRVKLNPKFSQSKCTVMVEKFVAYCVANFWRE